MNKENAQTQPNEDGRAAEGRVRAFLRRKDIEFSVRRYLLDALSAMTLGLFSTLIIGLIFQTLGEQLARVLGESAVTGFLVQIGVTAGGLLGAGVGVSVAWGLKAPPLVLFTSAVCGTAGTLMGGGPAGAFLAAAIGAECGKAVSKETRVDIIVTPAVTLIAGMLGAVLVGPPVGALMQGLGTVVMRATELQPFLMGIVVSVIVGLVLTAPISSAALAIMIGLSGLAGGAATAGCSAQMMGFAVISLRQNGVGGLLAQGLGTSMLQVPNIVRNPWILLPPTLAAAVLGPVSTLAFGMTNLPEGSGMGTSGLVGQIATLNAMGYTGEVLLKIALLHFVFPALLALLFDYLLRRAGKIKGEDYRLGL